MPLYNNILLSKKNESTSGTNSATNSNQTSKSASASMKFLQDHLQSKKRSQQPSALGKDTKIQKTNKSNENKIISESSLHKQSGNEWNLEDEYDPMVPNSYEILQLEYIKAKEQRLLERKAQQACGPINIKKTIPNLLEVLDKLDEDNDNVDDLIKKTANRGTAIGPPPSLAATTNSQMMSMDGISSSNNNNNKCLPDKKDLESSSGKLDSYSSVAVKIMQKMGYKTGQGLGKDEQGISSPIKVQRSGVNTGRIVISTESKQSTSSKASNNSTINKSDDPPNIKDLLKDSTRILLLENMVGPGEVDDDLESETKEECKKYGDVVKCLIFEIPNKKVPDDQAVRIFVEFSQIESAIKAVSDLNGRYFGGRIVRATFFSLERFNKLDLGPKRPTRHHDNLVTVSKSEFEKNVLNSCSFSGIIRLKEKLGQNLWDL